jgi:hypothetical protein
VNDIKISFRTRPLSKFEKDQRRVQRLAPLEFYHVCDIDVPGFGDHHGEGESQATALRRAADHWERYSASRW